MPLNDQDYQNTVKTTVSLVECFYNKDMKKPKIVDSFLFWNEFEMLKIRLEYLGDFVDHFLIAEANIDFSGKPKKLLLTPELIKNLPHSSKIIYQPCHINPFSPKWIFKRLRYLGRHSRFLWRVQDEQRNSLLAPAKKLPKDTLILFGDIDEIPNIDSIKTFIDQPNFVMQQPISFEQDFFYYTINNRSNESPKWYGTILANIADFIKLNPNYLRYLREQLKSISGGGWHLSYFMSAEKIREKILATADVEKKEEFKSMTSEQITHKIQTGEDLYSDKQAFPIDPDIKNKVDPKLLSTIKKYLPHCA